MKRLVIALVACASLGALAQTPDTRCNADVVPQGCATVHGDRTVYQPAKEAPL